MEGINIEMNAPAFYGMYGEKGGGRANSMMALMTEQDQEQERPASCEGMMTPMTMTIPPRSSFSSYSHGPVEGILSAAAMFNGGQDPPHPPPPGHNHHHSKHLVGGHFQNGQLAMNEQAAVISNSSLSSTKTEECSNRMEFEMKVGGRSCWPEPSLVVRALSHSQYLQQQQQKEAMVTSLEVESASSTNPKDSTNAMKTKIAGHPHYPRLLSAYLDCQKIGTPPEVGALLEEISEEKRHGRHSPTMSIGADPELDQFMEAYCEMLRKHQVELSKPYKEGMAFINQIETQLKSLNIGVVRNFPPAYSYEREGCRSSEDELSCGEVEVNEVDPGAQDKELKDQLLRKYSGYFSTLKKEFLKKRKKGKLPKEGRQKLLDWWSLHYKWPYPSEADKVALAESTGLDQKQINNWFINQRKRHWKPSEDMQIMVMDSFNPHTTSFFIHETEG